MTKIFVNGCFDLLHRGHLALLNHAKSQGDYLLVAIDSDQRVAQHKGSSRPVNDQITRKLILENLKAVDQELIDIIQAYQPDVMIVGGDWRGRSVIGSQYAKSLVFFDRIDDESTTKTIENYLDRRHLSR